MCAACHAGARRWLAPDGRLLVEPPKSGVRECCGFPQYGLRPRRCPMTWMPRLSSVGRSRLAFDANSEVSTRLLVCLSRYRARRRWTWRSRSDVPTLPARHPPQRVFGGRYWRRPCAAARTVAVTRVPHFIAWLFSAPGRTASDRRRRGGARCDSFSSRRVVARQGGKVSLPVSSFHGVEEGFEHLDPVPQDVRPSSVPSSVRCSSRHRAGQHRSGNGSGEFSTFGMSETLGLVAHWPTRGIRHVLACGYARMGRCPTTAGCITLRWPMPAT
jgi:hypothetical protein